MPFILLTSTEKSRACCLAYSSYCYANHIQYVTRETEICKKNPQKQQQQIKQQQQQKQHKKTNKKKQTKNLQEKNNKKTGNTP
jgi:hypothetical protein